jgi:hypothetical protein
MLFVIVLSCWWSACHSDYQAICCGVARPNPVKHHRQLTLNRVSHVVSMQGQPATQGYVSLCGAAARW